MTFKLIHGDAYEAIEDIIAGVISDVSFKKNVAIITDPPYKFNNSGGGKFRKARIASNIIVKQKMDKGFDDTILFHPGLDSVVCFMHNDQVFDLGARLKEYYHRAVIKGWIKKNPSPMENKNFIADSELYIHAWHKLAFPIGKGKKRFTTHGRVKDKSGHPAQKPLDLMREIVRTVNADVIIDPFMGSGTTGVACILEGKQFIGIEMDEDYYKIASERINNASN